MSSLRPLRLLRYDMDVLHPRQHLCGLPLQLSTLGQSSPRPHWTSGPERVACPGERDAVDDRLTDGYELEPLAQSDAGHATRERRDKEELATTTAIAGEI